MWRSGRLCRHGLSVELGTRGRYTQPTWSEGLSTPEVARWHQLFRNDPPKWWQEISRQKKALLIVNNSQICLEKSIKANLPIL